MTRETKVGIVVSCSFLCLVGTVVYVKYKSPDAELSLALAEGVGQMVPADPTPTVPMANAVEVAAVTSSTENVTPAHTLTVPPYTPPPADANAKEAKSEINGAPSPTPPPSSTTFNEPSPAPTPAGDGTASEPNKDSKATAPIWEAPGATKTISKDQGKSPQPESIKPDETATLPPEPTPPNNDAKGDTAQIPPPVIPAGQAETLSSSTVTPVFQPENANTPATAPPRVESPNGASPSPAPTPSSNSGHAPFPPPPPPDELDTKPSPVRSTPTFIPSEKGPTTPAALPMTREDTPSTFSPAATDPTAPKPAPTPTVPDANVRLNPPVGVNPRDFASPPPRPDSTPNAGAGGLPPVGANGTRASPPIAVPVPPSSNGRSTSNFVPQVESYDEETYRCKSGDTLENVSQRYYTSDKYARALLLFNRNHPRPAAGIITDPPQLVDGQPLYIPPPHILEKYYAYAVAGLRISPSVVVPASATSTGIPNGSTPRAGQRYVVRQPEMISTIARNTLGNLERWTEIYELNGRGFDPSRPIAAGTVLVMPADARVADSSQ